MSSSMSDRQREILLAIIKEFMESALPVGSAIVADKYSVKASPATIRNEMVELAEMGYLDKSHFSAGRIPTPVAYRYYIDRMMKEDELDYMEEIEIRQELHRQRFTRDKLLKSAVDSLSDHLKYASVGLIDEDICFSGISEILDYQEFQDLDNLKNILAILEDYRMLSEIFKKALSDSEIKILVGDEAGFRSFGTCSLVFAEFDMYQGQKGYIAVIGPMRMTYSYVIPRVRFIAKSLSSVTRGW